LHARGTFTWSEWSNTLVHEIKHGQTAGDPDSEATYYLLWLRALERVVVQAGVTSMQTLTMYRDAWDRAAHRTPHGHAIELQPGDG
jgi:nitrile hydratase accessory protein